MTRGSCARVGIFVVALLTTACTMGTNEAKDGVAEFRARVSRQSFKEIYQAAAPEFRQAATEEEFVRFMSALDRKLGPWQSASEPGWHVARTTAGHSVQLAYESRFTKGPAAEQFAWRIEGGRPVLLGYNVNSRLLVSD